MGMTMSNFDHKLPTVPEHLITEKFPDPENFLNDQVRPTGENAKSGLTKQVRISNMLATMTQEDILMSPMSKVRRADSIKKKPNINGMLKD